METKQKIKKEYKKYGMEDQYFEMFSGSSMNDNEIEKKKMEKWRNIRINFGWLNILQKCILTWLVRRELTEKF